MSKESEEKAALRGGKSSGSNLKGKKFMEIDTTME